MSERLSGSLRKIVIKRAMGRCEYCLIHQTFSAYSHEVDHVIAIKHGGKSVSQNLVLACLPCNRHKGSDIASLDPVTGAITPLFNPRTQSWSDHFYVERGFIFGLTSVGRTTTFLLKMNQVGRVRLRQALLTEGLYPDIPEYP
ncbi:MAG: HNH endonuclease [Synechocystis sp.]|jgi:hypothetical protein